MARAGAMTAGGIGVVAALALALPAAAAQAPVIGKVVVVKSTPTQLVVEAPVDPAGADTAVHLEYGRTPSLGGQTNTVGLTASQSVPVDFTLSSLSPKTAYYYSYVAVNEAGTTRTPVAKVVTPAAGARVLKPPAVAFAISTGPSAGYPWALLAASRPSRLPDGTRVSIRCVTNCHGGRAVRIGSGNAQIRFRPAIHITRRSVIEIRATLAGYVGRVRRFVFRRSGALITAYRVLNRCLSGDASSRVVACPKSG